MLRRRRPTAKEMQIVDDEYNTPNMEFQPFGILGKGGYMCCAVEGGRPCPVTKERQIRMNMKMTFLIWHTHHFLTDNDNVEACAAQSKVGGLGL